MTLVYFETFDCRSFAAKRTFLLITNTRLVGVHEDLARPSPDCCHPKAAH